MKGIASKKVLTLALGAVLVAALLATAPLATAVPIEVWWIQVVDQTGRPFANEEILVAVWNETGNCAIAYFKGKADAEGKATLTILPEYVLDTEQPYTDQTFNITIAINKYGRWLLLHTKTGLTWSDLVADYINKTVTADHWWSLRFTAYTDPDGDGTFDTPLYFSTGLGEDLASFQVFWNDTRVFITEIWAESGTATAKALFNISDTEVTFTEVDLGCFIFQFKPVVLYKEVIWNLFVNEGEYTPVKVGAEILKFDATAKTLSIINATPIGEIGPTIATVRLTPVTDVTDYAYTVFLRVNVLDACGSLIDTGAFETWKVFIQALIDNRNVILRSGTPAKGVAPAFGAVAPDLKFAFWVPDVTKVYGKKYNVTVNINYYNVQVFTATIPTNVTSLTLTDQLGTYMVLTTTPQNVRVIDAFTSVVKTRIIVKDMQPTPQPLSGARLIIAAVVGDPIYSATGPGGAAYLPPFTTIAVAETSGNFGRAYASVYSEDGVPYGYLPVPFTYRARRDLVATYAVRIFWVMPGGENWVDVTPDQNTFALNITAQITQGCPITTFTFFAKVFEVKVRVLDLCNQPVTPAAYPGAYLVAYLDGRPIGVVGLGVDGTMDVGHVPAGKLKFRLYWKGMFLRANVTQPVEPEIEVTKNIATAVTLVYPIGNLNITLTMWDINYPIHKLDVKLQYVKDGRVVYEEPAKVTDCYGRVTFTKVPIRPLTVDEGAGRSYELRVIAYTREDTPYIRPQDAGLLVANETIKFDVLKVHCWNEYVVPTWIYSFRVIAVDHTGATLKGLPTDIGTIPVAVLLNDTAYGKQMMCCPEICAPPTCVCPAPGLITVDFRILNETKAEAIFVYYSQQYYDSDPEKDIIGIQPHMFVAGAKYHFMVFHGGVLVYNYTITLPKPFETKTVFFNETTMEVTEVEGETYTYTWLTDGKGSITHPILVFRGAKSWRDAGKRADAQLRLVTWVQTLEVRTLTNAGKFAVPFLNLTLIRTDVLNWTLVGGKYDVLSKPAAWADKWTNYAWNAVGGADGVIRIQVPVWVPSRTGQPWIRNIKFGANITHVAVLAGSNWKSPGVPDTPEAYTVTLQNATGIGINHTLFGYIVNWNHTAKEILIDAKEFYPEWTKAGVTFRGNNTWFLGDFWNMTYWSGASKTVRTVAMDGFCVTVLAPPPCPGEPKAGLANVPVWVTAVGHTDKTLDLASGRTDATGTVKFGPPAVFAYKFGVDKFADLPEIRYTICTKQNFEDVLKPYGLDEAKANLCPEVLCTTVTFGEKHNEFKECITLEWEAIYLYIEDWSGKPLVNMMVAATKMYPTPSGGITTFAFSKPFAGSAIARLLVTPGSAYTVTVYWRDSYLLAAAGAIPGYINIYDSFADEITPRLFASSVFTVPGGFVTSAGGTIKTFVYIGLIELRTKEGKTLSPEALAKITVTITWPDGVVTQVKPGTDGVAPIILNAGTVKSWPHPASAAYNPESPHPQSPAGDYKVVVEWAGVGKIAEKTLRIHRAKLDTPEVREPVYVDVTDVTITLSTPFNTPMAGATVTATKLDGTTLTLTADAQGRITVPEAPLGKVDVTVTTWNGMPINFKATGVTGTVTVGNIGRLIVTVVGARGQGLEGARVSISGAGVTVVGTTDSAGKFALELPAGTYTVTAEKGGRTASTSVSVAGGQTAETTLKVDVFMTLAGWEMSFSEF
ncbi:MAG: carboxypeptidase-like regulatory domain-containing protein, partial [Thermofilaceae archaeon]